VSFKIQDPEIELVSFKIQDPETETGTVENSEPIQNSCNVIYNEWYLHDHQE
jgi:hypothetical protein